jgi:hypothetical protein
MTSLRPCSGLCAALLIVGLAAGGCGPNRAGVPPLAPVTGTVTLDGRPLPGVGVVFTAGSGQSSFGKTDAEGRYELRFVRGLKGAVIGPSRVWFDGKSGLERPPGPNFKDPIPSKYGPDGDLRAEVVAGRNVIDFDLESR